MTVPVNVEHRSAALADYFAGLTRAKLTQLSSWYRADARFKDPFNEVQGVAEIQRIFEHMYERLDEPRFEIRQTIAQGEQAFIVWDFLFRFKGAKATQVIRGASHLRFDKDGLVFDHRDYWDAAEELYEKLPVLGMFMKWLRKRASS